MPIQITLELSDADLEYFRVAMRDAQKKMRGRDEAAILAGARHLARQTRTLALPDFVKRAPARARHADADAGGRGLEARRRAPAARVPGAGLLRGAERPGARLRSRASACSTTPSWWSSWCRSCAPSSRRTRLFCALARRGDGAARRRPRGAASGASGSGAAPCTRAWRAAARSAPAAAAGSRSSTRGFARLRLTARGASAPLASWQGAWLAGSASPWCRPPSAARRLPPELPSRIRAASARVLPAGRS